MAERGLGGSRSCRPPRREEGSFNNSPKQNKAKHEVSCWLIGKGVLPPQQNTKKETRHRVRKAGLGSFRVALGFCLCAVDLLFTVRRRLQKK